MQSPVVPLQSTVEPDSTPSQNKFTILQIQPYLSFLHSRNGRRSTNGFLACNTPNPHGISSESDDTLLRREDEACQILRISTSAKEIMLVCSRFPFRDTNIPLGILSERLYENLKCFTSTEHIFGDDHVNEPILRKAKNLLERTTPDLPNPPIWKGQWSPPDASSMGSTQVADIIHEEMFTAFSKVTFLALVKGACGHRTDEVTELLNGAVRTRLELCRRFKELHQSKEQYQAVEAELRTQCPLAYWVVSTSIRITNDSTDPSKALASILIPIRELFENRELPLIPMLQRLKTLAVLHQKILDGDDLEWEGLLSADFSFLENINDHKPRELAELLTKDDLSCFQKFCPNDFLCPEGPSSSRRLRDMGTKWSNLADNVKLCANAHPDLVERISEITKDLLDGGNLFSGMAFLEGLRQTNQRPAKLSKYWELLSSSDNYAVYRRFWSTISGLPFLLPHVRMIRTTGAENRKATILSDLFRFAGFPGLPVRIEVDPGNDAELEIESGSKPTVAETKSGRSSCDETRPALHILQTKCLSEISTTTLQLLQGLERKHLQGRDSAIFMDMLAREPQCQPLSIDPQVDTTAPETVADEAELKSASLYSQYAKNNSRGSLCQSQNLCPTSLTNCTTDIVTAAPGDNSSRKPNNSETEKDDVDESVNDDDDELDWEDNTDPDRKKDRFPSVLETDEENDTSDWEDSDTESIDDKSLFQRVDSIPNLTTRRSLLTLAVAALPACQRRTSEGLSLAAPPDSNDGFEPVAEVPRTGTAPQPIIQATSNGNHSGLPLSLRTTRRNMLTTEVPSSLRGHLLWEHQQKSPTANASLKRRITSNDVAWKQCSENGHMRKDSAEMDKGWFRYLGSNSSDYHIRGW